MKVKEIMTKNLISISPDASLREAGELFKAKRVSGFPVMDDKGKVVGIVTITDMMRILSQIYELRESEKVHVDMSLSKMYEEEKAKAKVRNIMSKNVIVLTEEDSIEEVMKLMFHNNIHTIPVSDSTGKIVGVIGRRDLISVCF